MTPAENKQTVEPWAAGFRYWAMADGNPKSTWLITRETARAVVAQADRAAELEAAPRTVYLVRDGALQTAGVFTSRELAEEYIATIRRHPSSYDIEAVEVDALAGDGGGA